MTLSIRSPDTQKRALRFVREISTVMPTLKSAIDIHVVLLVVLHVYVWYTTCICMVYYYVYVAIAVINVDPTHIELAISLHTSDHILVISLQVL